jgi:hypothetical protein
VFTEITIFRTEDAMDFKHVAAAAMTVEFHALGVVTSRLQSELRSFA